MATTSTTPQVDVLNSIFQGLKNKSHEARLQSALELRRYARFHFRCDQRYGGLTCLTGVHKSR